MTTTLRWHAPGATAAAAVLAATLTAGAAAAQDDAAFRPHIEGEIYIELQDDYFFKSDDPGAEINDLYTKTEPSLAFFFAPGWSVQAGLVLEPVEDPMPYEDRLFDDQGLFAEQLFLQYEDADVRLFGGKLNPPFGRAWELAPGIYGVDFAEDYEITERIGAGAAYSFGSEAMGFHTITGSLFMADTSILSESVFENRGRTRLSDGGASNTGEPTSFAITLDGEGVPIMPDIGYHLGVSHQEAGEGDFGDETAVVASLIPTFDLGEDLAVEGIAEVAQFWNAGGSVYDALYVTAGAALLVGPWNLSASYTLRNMSADDGSPDIDDDLFQLTAGYAFDFGLAIDVGYRFTREDQVESHAFGSLLRYTYGF